MANLMQRPFQRLRLGNSEKWQFFRQWLRHPRATAAVSPSGPQLVKAMIAEVPQLASRVIELGVGTGVMTHAILARGIAPENLLAIELNPELHRFLCATFPKVNMLCADARQLLPEAQKCGYAEGGMADAVVSSLGLLSMPRELQRDILKASFECLTPDGCFIQFTYGPVCPVSRDVLEELGLFALRGGTVLRNVPPATVFVLRRTRSRAIVPRSKR